MLKTTLRPLGVHPPLHWRRMDFLTKSFRISVAKVEARRRFVARTSFGEGAARTAEWYREAALP